MKIALPIRGNVVEDHFGRCEMYVLFTVDANHQIIHSELISSPQGCGCKSDIAATLQLKGVSVMLAGNMGDGALNVLNRYGIKVYRGCSGDVRQVTEAFLKGIIDDSGESCKQHEQHQCNHS